MAEPAREQEPLTRDQLFGWLARLYQRYQDEQAQTEEPACEDSKDSE